MSKFKIELNDQKIINEGVKSTIDFYQTIAIKELNFPGINAFATGVDSPFLNVVIDTRESADCSSEMIIALEDFFNHCRAPWAWLLMPFVKINQLETCGFSLLDEAPGMYFNLTNLLPNNRTSSIHIEELKQGDDLSYWIKPVYEGYGGSDNGEKYRRLNADLLQKAEKKLRHYVAYYNGQIAAAGTLFLSHQSVMLHNLATRTAFRKLGIGTELTLYMMRDAKKIGYEHCFLESSDDGFNLYKKLGFRVYCTTLAYRRKNLE